MFVLFSFALYNIMSKDLKLLVWDDSKTTKVAEVMRKSKFIKMMESGLIVNNNAHFVVESLDFEPPSDNRADVSPQQMEEFERIPNEIETTDYQQQNAELAVHDIINIDDPENEENYDANEQVHLTEISIFDSTDNQIDATLCPASKSIVKSSYVHFPQTDMKINRDGSIRIYKDLSSKVSDEEAAGFLIVPADIIARDKKLDDEFYALYDVTMDLGSLNYIVGGRCREFLAFHYPETTSYPSNNRKGRAEFVEKSELQLLYFFDIKSAVSFSYIVANKIHIRFLFTFCYLACNAT